MPSLLSLPGEILEMILEHLDEAPPSYFFVGQIPNPGIITGCKYPPIKCFSRICRAFRTIVIPRLFRHTYQIISIDARQKESEREGQIYPAWPRDFWDFVSFLESSGFGKLVRSFTLVVKEHPDLDFSDVLQKDLEEAEEYKARWRHLMLDVTPLLMRVTIIAPPFVLGMVSGLAPEFADPGEHNDYQVLSLYNEETDWTSSASEYGLKHWPLLTTRPWEFLSFNDGLLFRATGQQDTDVSGSHFLASSLRDIQVEFDVLPNLSYICYTGILATSDYLHNIRALLASFPRLVHFQFSLQWTDSVIAAIQRFVPRDLILMNVRHHQVHLMLLDLSSDYGKQQLATELAVPTCLENLGLVECIDEGFQ